MNFREGHNRWWYIHKPWAFDKEAKGIDVWEKAIHLMLNYLSLTRLGPVLPEVSFEEDGPVRHRSATF
jgi:hypothetical protein